MDERSFNNYVKMTIDSGVAPLSINFKSIVDTDTARPIAYMTNVTVNSVISGTLKEEDYTSVCDKTKTGLLMFKHILQHLLTILNELKNEELSVKFLTLRIPSTIIDDKVDLFSEVKEILNKNPKCDPAKICVVFDDEILKKDLDKAKYLLLDLRLLGLKTMITGCGKFDFPIPNLLKVTPDFVLLNPFITDYADSRDKPGLVVGLATYLKSMGIDVICMGDEKKRLSLRNVYGFGFISDKAENLTKEQVFDNLRVDSL